MKVQKSELAQKINKLKSIVPKKTTTPVLQGILVDDGYLIANNMEIAVKMKLEGTEGERFLIPMKAMETINNLPSGEIDISSGKNIITIKTGSVKSRHQTLDPDLFPELRVPDGEEQEIVLDGMEMAAAMRNVSFAVSKTDYNAVMESMCLQAADGYLNFIGLNGKQLAWDRMNYPGNFELLIPKDAIDKLLNLDITGDVTIRHSRTGAVFIADEFEVHTRLVDGQYFQWRKMFDYTAEKINVERADLLAAATRANICAEDQPVRLNFDGGALNISIKEKTADYQEEVATDGSLERSVLIGFDPRLLIETLKAFCSETITLCLSGPKTPMVVETGGSNFKAILLPVLIR